MSDTIRTGGDIAGFLLELLQGASKTIFLNDASGWNLSIPTCEWEGIICASQDVIEIDLSGRNLKGTLPEKIGSIQSLHSINLSSNGFDGTIPATWAALPLLKTLDLSRNLLKGSVPVLASNNVEFFLLGYNQLTGTIPGNFGNNAANMIIYDVSNNKLRGPIPDLGNKFPKLEELDLSDNLIDGKITSSIGRLTTLKRIFLSNNRLSGTIPISLGDSTLALEEINLHGNILTGTLPSSLAELKSLTILFIDDNNLTGEVPQALCDKNLNEVFFRSGAGTLVSPNMTLLTTGQALNGDLATSNAYRMRVADPGTERDGCTSIACPAGYKSQATNTKDGVFPCVACEMESLTPYLGSNKCFDIQEDVILQNFFNSAKGESWTVGSNWGDASVPKCMKEGVTCSTDGAVTAIDLHDKGLAGTIPADLGFLPKLTFLDLSYNQLEGQLPAGLRFAPLVLLNVAGNLLTGHVPRGLCQAEGINGNGEGGIFTCDTIACQAGFYSPNGRAAPGLYGAKCAQCPGTEDPFLAIVECEAVRDIHEGITPFGLIGEIGIAIMGFGILLGLFWVWKRSSVSREYIGNRAYELHGPGKSLIVQDAYDRFSHPESDVDEIDPLDGMDGLGHGSLSRMEIKVKDEWSSGKETQKEVWLDVPKIS